MGNEEMQAIKEVYTLTRGLVNCVSVQNEKLNNLSDKTSAFMNDVVQRLDRIEKTIRILTSCSVDDIGQESDIDEVIKRMEMMKSNKIEISYPLLYTMWVEKGYSWQDLVNFCRDNGFKASKSTIQRNVRKYMYDNKLPDKGGVVHSDDFYYLRRNQ